MRSCDAYQFGIMYLLLARDDFQCLRVSLVDFNDVFQLRGATMHVAFDFFCGVDARVRAWTLYFHVGRKHNCFHYKM